MSITRWDKKSPQITIPFPEEKFQKYLESTDSKDLEKLTVEEITKLFVSMVRNFDRGVISSDELSEMSAKLWQSLVHKEKSGEFNKEKNKDLFESLLFAAELGFYARVTHLPNSYIAFIRRIFDFADKHK